MGLRWSQPKNEPLPWEVPGRKGINQSSQSIGNYDTPSPNDANNREIKKAIIGANEPIASVRAKPKIALPNNCFPNESTSPILNSAPPNPIVAIPAPIN